MLFLGPWVSKLSVHLTFTINMVESKYANNSRHSGRAVPRAKNESSPREALREGIGSSKRGIRTAPREAEEGTTRNASAPPLKAAGEARD